jgi:hypothetical protein
MWRKSPPHSHRRAPSAHTRSAAAPGVTRLTAVRPIWRRWTRPACAARDFGELAGRSGGHIAGIMADRILLAFGYPQAHEDDARARRASHCKSRRKRNGPAPGRSPNVGPTAAGFGVHTGLLIAREPPPDEPVRHRPTHRSDAAGCVVPGGARRAGRSAGEHRHPPAAAWRDGQRAGGRADAGRASPAAWRYFASHPTPPRRRGWRRCRPRARRRSSGGPSNVTSCSRPGPRLARERPGRAHPRRAGDRQVAAGA